jgi:hypothetical protein
MTQRWQILGLSTVLAAALAVAPARAADPELPKLTDSQKLDRLLDQIHDLRKSVDDLEKRSDLQVQVVQERINALSARLRLLEGDMEGLRGQLSPTTRTAGYAGPAAPPPAPTTGTIRLRNTFPTEQSVVVNGVSYQLAPGDTRDLPAQPPGTFSYEVLGVMARKVATLAPGEIVTITVYPR